MSTLYRNRTSSTSSSKNEIDCEDGNNKGANKVVRVIKNENNEDSTLAEVSPCSLDFASLGISSSLVSSCQLLGFRRPTAIQRVGIPLILRGDSHVVAISKTGSGKTACFALPIITELMKDPYSNFALIITPTRELAQQIHEQVRALGSRGCQVRCGLLTGGVDITQQMNEVVLKTKPHILVATPGRLAYILRGPPPRPNLSHLRFIVLDEADRLLSPGGFERDMAEIMLQTTASITKKRQNIKTQTLLFSATMTQSLQQIQSLTSSSSSSNTTSLPWKWIQINEDTLCQTQHDGNRTEVVARVLSTHPRDEDSNNHRETIQDVIPRIPSGLAQEYIFMPSRVREAYLVTAIRKLVRNGGRKQNLKNDCEKNDDDDVDDDEDNSSSKIKKARSAIVFTSTCEKAARLEALLQQLHIDCVSLHGLLTQDRRAASLGKFKSHQVRILIATDLASRGLDIPEVDLVINMELPRASEEYIHRVGRTARAGRRGLAVSLVGERDISLVHACEQAAGRPLLKCESVSDAEAIQFLSIVTKATRLANRMLLNTDFPNLVQKRLDRRANDKREYRKAKRGAKERLLQVSHSISSENTSVK